MDKILDELADGVKFDLGKSGLTMNSRVGR
jgi:hypothetical protein